MLRLELELLELDILRVEFVDEGAIVCMVLVIEMLL